MCSVTFAMSMSYRDHLKVVMWWCCCGERRNRGVAANDVRPEPETNP
jgi:hypothetical protein